MLANLSMKKKLLLTILLPVLLAYLATVFLVYQSSKASTEALAEVAVEAIAHWQAREISAYFDGALFSARTTAGLLANEMLDGVLPDRRIADQIVETALRGNAEAGAMWWVPLDGDSNQMAFWLRGDGDGGVGPAPDNGREELLRALGDASPEREIVLPPRPLPGLEPARRVIAVRVPVHRDGRLVGHLGIGLDAARLQERVARLRPLDVGVAALLAQDTTLVAHPDPTRLGRPQAETEKDFLGEHLDETGEAVRRGRAMTLRFVAPAMGEEIFMQLVPVAIGETGTAWSLGIALPSSALLGGVKALALKLLVLGCFVVLLLVGMIYLLGRMLASPLEAVMQTVRQLASGEADLRARLPAKGRDELGILSSEFNRFLNAMADLVLEIKETSWALQTTSRELQEESQTSGVTIDAQRDEVAQLAAAMQQVATTVEEVAGNAGQAAHATREGDLAVTQGQTSVTTLAGAIREDAQAIEQVAALTVQLDEASQEIGAIVTVIRDIAAQTNLLALNAAIESARAGEQGRGFAVVADEVRALAGRTHSSTEEVYTSILSIQERTRSVVEMVRRSRDSSRAKVAGAHEASESLQRISEMFGRVRAMGQQIATATEQQAATSEQLSRSLASIADSAEFASRSAGQVRRRSDDLRAQAERLDGLVSRFRL